MGGYEHQKKTEIRNLKNWKRKGENVVCNFFLHPATYLYNLIDSEKDDTFGMKYKIIQRKLHY